VGGGGEANENLSSYQSHEALSFLPLSLRREAPAPVLSGEMEAIATFSLIEKLRGKSKVAIETKRFPEGRSRFGRTCSGARDSRFDGDSVSRCVLIPVLESSCYCGIQVRLVTGFLPYHNASTVGGNVKHFYLLKISRLRTCITYR
jgi:hypothetical protein